MNWIATNKPGVYYSYIGKIRVEKSPKGVCIGSMSTALIKFENEKTLLKFLTV